MYLAMVDCMHVAALCGILERVLDGVRYTKEACPCQNLDPGCSKCVLVGGIIRLSSSLVFSCKENLGPRKKVNECSLKGEFKPNPGLGHQHPRGDKGFSHARLSRGGRWEKQFDRSHMFTILKVS